MFAEQTDVSRREECRTSIEETFGLLYWHRSWKQSLWLWDNNEDDYYNFRLSTRPTSWNSHIRATSVGSYTSVSVTQASYHKFPAPGNLLYLNTQTFYMHNCVSFAELSRPEHLLRYTAANVAVLQSHERSKTTILVFWVTILYR
jgi:hypothetical protein